MFLKVLLVQHGSMCLLQDQIIKPSMLETTSMLREGNPKLAKISQNFSICYRSPRQRGRGKAETTILNFLGPGIANMEEIILLGSSNFSKYVGKRAYSVLSHSLVYSA